MSLGNTDYERKYMDLFGLLPDVYKSNTNRSLFNDLFNRFLTKQEVRKIAGYIGDPNPRALVRRQIEEPTIHRQGFQLQPILNAIIGSIRHMSSWKDIENELRRLGVDIERMSEWGEVKVFNWVPPIDIDKLINYSNYYWVGSDKPDYITIKSRCTVADARVIYWDKIIDDFGAENPITEIDPYIDEGLFPVYDVTSIDSPNNTVKITGDLTEYLENGDFFYITLSDVSDGKHRIQKLSYDKLKDESTIGVFPGTLPPTAVGNKGKVVAKFFDKIVIAGNSANLFTEGFSFYIKDSENIELDSAVWTTMSSSYNESDDETVIQINAIITDSSATGVVSFTEQREIAETSKLCICGETSPWDDIQWDDNPSEPLWGGRDPGDHKRWLDTVSGASVPTDKSGEQFYDTTANILYSWDEDVSAYTPIIRNFSSMLERTIGNVLWDDMKPCDISTELESTKQWSSVNKWVHQTNVVNFDATQKAQAPIIEFAWDLQLNEWSYTEYVWNYRVSSNTKWNQTLQSPNLFELTPIKLWETGLVPNRIVIDERYGDLSDVFVPGFEFRAVGTTEIYTVVDSFYSRESDSAQLRTSVVIDAFIPRTELETGDLDAELESITPLRPIETSQGDEWKGYGAHWLFKGSKDTIPSNRVAPNGYVDIPEQMEPTLHPSKTFSYVIGNYSQIIYTHIEDFTSEIPLIDATYTHSTRPLRRRALLGQNDIRVYINDIRQYGNYDELEETENSIDYVSGIKFLPDVKLNNGDKIKIEVGEAAANELGLYSVPVRIHETNNDYKKYGDQYVSLISYRKTEQKKTTVNQYPIFDIFHVDGSNAFKANHIFGYRTDQEYGINAAVGQRIVFDPLTKIFDFEQLLIEEDDGPLFAYRDFSNMESEYWYNPLLNKVYFWKGQCWTDKALMGDFYREAIISPDEPEYFYTTVNGMYWYDTSNHELKKRNLYRNRWDVIENVNVGNNDHTLQTIWKEGMNDETYIPEKVDWDRRTKEEYNEQKALFVEETKETLLSQDPDLTESDAIITATKFWFTKESNTHSTDGEWMGDWEIPDPLYFNNMHENRVVVNSAELRVHFGSIIDSQELIPGFTGTQRDMFHLIPINDVNYGVGGSIHEYNDSFDTFLSSAFVNNVTPISLLDFAASQYAVLLTNSIIDIYRDNLIDFMTSTSLGAEKSVEDFVINSVIEQHWENDYFNFVYGDSSTYNEDTNEGMRNWIATLPYIKVSEPVQPSKIVDVNRGIYEIQHHDGHYKTYEVNLAEKESIITSLIATPDVRTTEDPDLTDDTWGRRDVQLPPNNMVEFEAGIRPLATTSAIDFAPVSRFFTTPENRQGVYWHWIPSFSVRILYKFNVVSAGDEKPSNNNEYADGALWFDMTHNLEVLRIKRTNSEGFPVWDVVDGLTTGDGRFHNGTDPKDLRTATISAWQAIDVGDILMDTIFEVEKRLYNNVPEGDIVYDVSTVRDISPTLFDQYMEESFLDYVTLQEIVSPYENVDYQQDDPWTWNYTYCIVGGGHDIVYSDDVNSEFHISENYAAKFDTCYNHGLCPSQVSFYIKNSKVNDGSWQTILSTGNVPAAYYDATKKVTVIKVEGEVSPSIEGFIYLGDLPGSMSTGAESGSYWKTYYKEVYGTPYPHIEPWVLQGYENEPDWWDETYLNDDGKKWGIRRWKYSHGFDIVNSGTDFNKPFFQIDGNFLEVLLIGETIKVDRTDSGEVQYTMDRMATVISQSVLNREVTISDDYTSTFTSDTSITMYNGALNLGIFTVSSSRLENGDTVITVNEQFQTVSQLGAVYNSVTNTSMFFTTVDIAPVSNVSPAPIRRVKHAYGMWENIRTGVIPPGKQYPNGTTSITGNPKEDRRNGVDIDDLETWLYFSVNIDNHVHTDYIPDALFPPYWDFTESYGTEARPRFDDPVKSIFFDFGNEIFAPGTDYTFGSGSPIEWEWRTSAQYLYDHLKACYRLDPVRYVSGTFGIEFYTVGGLQLDKINETPLSHQRTHFHGDILGSEPLSFNGTNQWYVNFNRYLSFDTNFSDFANLWKGWTAPMTYQFATFVDTPSFQIGHRSVPISKFDYTIDTKVSRGIKDFWMDAFKLSITNIPPDILRYDTQHEWTLDVNSHVAISRNIKHYDIQNYQFYVDLDPGPNIWNAPYVCHLHTWEITEVDIYNKIFEIQGDQTKYISAGQDFIVFKSSGNDGNYTTYDVAYNGQVDITRIEIAEAMPSIEAGGLLKLDGYRDIPWETGEKVYTSSTETLPAPLRSPDLNGLEQNFILRVEDSSLNPPANDPSVFLLARTAGDANQGIALNLTSKGRGDQFVGKIHSTFKAMEGNRTNTIWIHYVSDKTRVIETSLPTSIKGMQNLVNFMGGYDIYTREEGWRVNDEYTMVDEFSSRPVSWQLELEKFIDYAYGIRKQRYSVKDRYNVAVFAGNDEFTFIDKYPGFKTGDGIIFYSSNGVYPEPIFRFLTYYYIHLDDNRFKIAPTKRDAERGNSIDITSVNGIREIYIGKPRDRREEYPKSGINPFRSAIWFRPPEGVISNVVNGPTEDIRSVQTIVDQYGRRMNSTDLRIFREDKRTQISARDNITNTIEPPVYYFYPSHNDYIHIGGIHLFTDEYEHCLIFNNYTTDGDLLYDPFIGLNTTKFEMLFNRQLEFTKRPNVGGYYYYDKHNLHSDLISNIEHGVESLRYAYDTFRVLESNKLASEVRKSVGYTGIKDYLSKINVNQKSQFLFWRGFIQQKGTLNSVEAYLQSKRFVDAKIDEFWAVKIAEFGDESEKEFPEMYVTTKDSTSNDWRFQFEEIVVESECIITRNTQTFENTGSVSGFLLDFEAPLGNLEVYVNGSKLISSDYTQSGVDRFTVLEGILSEQDIIEAQCWIPPEGVTIERRAQSFTASEGENTFNLDFDTKNGNLAVYVNGTKLIEEDYIHASVDSFTIKDNLLDSEDIVEAVTWKLPNESEYQLFRKAEYFEANKDQKDFHLAQFNTGQCESNNLDVIVNGKKLTNNDFAQFSSTYFQLNNVILSADDDIVEAETWLLVQVG